MGLVTDEAGLRRTVEAWIADDPEEGDRAELRGLLDEADEGVTDAVAELRDRFADRLHFGTAGLRGVGAAGANRGKRAGGRGGAGRAEPDEPGRGPGGDRGRRRMAARAGFQFAGRAGRRGGGVRRAAP